VSVTASFDWQSGTLYGGIGLGSATMKVSGQGSQASAGTILVVSNAVLSDTTIGFFEGCRFTNHGSMSTSGQVSLTWASGSSPLVSSSGTLIVNSGTMTLSDVPALISGPVTIAADAAMVIQSFTAPSFLVPGASVGGGGTLRVENSGRVYAVTEAPIQSGTTIVLGPGGQIEDKRAPVLNQSLVGSLSGTQGLMVQGTMHWTGGSINGNVTIANTGVLSVDGPLPHVHSGGTVLLAGSGAVVGPADIQVDKGALRIDGDLLLQSPIGISNGRGWGLDIRGQLRIAGAGSVTVGNNKLDNRGIISVEEGVLRLSMQRGLVTQQPKGSLRISSGATLQADSQLSLNGTISGSGRFQGDLEVVGTIQPGTLSESATLTIEGSLQLGADSTTRLTVRSHAEHSQINVTGQVAAGGTLLVDAPGYTPAAGDHFDILAGNAGNIVAGRYKAAKLPAPAGGRYLSVRYEGANVALRSAESAPGFDLQNPPANAVLRAWVNASPYRWAGYYLHAPCHGASWNGRRAFLAGLGLGMLVIFVGQQTAGASPCHANDTTFARGQADATLAINRADAEGFARGTWIYLDVEVNPHQISTDMLAYIRGWADAILANRQYSPGMYVHRREFAAVDRVVTSAFQAAGRTDRARYWCNGGPAVSALTDPPARCGIPEAGAWQQRANFDQTFGGHTLTIDRSVSIWADPSQP
jgi:hypothetical protein